MQVNYIAKQDMPVIARGALAEAIDHLARARRSGQVLVLTFGPEEGSSAVPARYRKAAAQLGVAVRIGRIHQPERIYIEILEATKPEEPKAKPAPEGQAVGVSAHWNAGKPTNPEPETDPPPSLVLGSELLGAGKGNGRAR